MKRPPTCPCLGCEDRTVGCHGDCEKYAGWKKKDWEYKSLRYKDKHSEIQRYITERNRNGIT